MNRRRQLVMALTVISAFGCSSPTPPSPAAASVPQVTPTPSRGGTPTPIPSVGAPEATVVSTETVDGVTTDDITFDGGRPSVAYLVRPAEATAASSPGIVWFHWFETNSPVSNRTEFLVEAQALAQSGVVSLLVEGTFPWHEAPSSAEDDLAALDAELTMLDAAYAVLVARPEVDPDRTAVVGHDFGAMYASALFARQPRIATLAMMAPTARWADWFARYWPITDDPADYGAALAALDPVGTLSETDARPVLLQFGTQDRFVPTAVADEIESAAGPGVERHEYNAGHQLNDAARVDRDAWLAKTLSFQFETGAPSVNVCATPIGIAEAAGTIWVACYFAGSLARIDPATRTLLEPVQVGLGAIGVTAATGSLWVTLHELGQVARVDPATGEVLATIDVGPQPEGVAGDDNGIWVTLEETGKVRRIDPATNEADPPIAVGREPRHVGLGFGSLWVTNFGSATMTRIDPLTNEVIATIDTQFGPEGIAFTDDYVWVANVRDNSVSRFDPDTNAVADTFPIGTATEGLLSDPDGLLWAAVTGAFGVAGIDPETGANVDPRTVGTEPRRMVIHGDELWVTNTGDGTVGILAIH
jgi:YVTN family beta-propeller protein